MTCVSEQFIVTFDIDECEDFQEEYPDKEFDEDEKKEVAEWLKIQQHSMDYYDLSNVENYIRWYVHQYQGTIEQPYTLYDEYGNILTARSYYKAKEKTMVEMKLLFDDSQLDGVKNFLIQIGFVFEDLSSMFDTGDSFGTIKNPYPLVDSSNEMLYAYNCFNSGNRMTSEMRLVFCVDSLEQVKTSLKAGRFIICK